MNKRLVVLLLLCFGGLSLVAQNRYMVFFTDKNNSAFSVDQPLDFLSQRAIDRREKNGVSITGQDLPVNNEYVDGIKGAGADVYFTTKWMNGALVQMDESLVAVIKDLSYVSDVELVAPGTLLSHTKVPVTIPDTFLEPSKVTGNTDIQLGLIGADDMHADGYRGKGIIIAVFDNGFLGVNQYKPFQHVFDEDRMVLTRDFARNSGNVYQHGSHGSATFSCIAAVYGDHIMGTAPEASYILCVTEIEENEFRIEEYNWLLAAEFADSAGVDVINTSLGYTDFDTASMDYTYGDLDGKTTVVTQAAQLLADRGVVVVTSAGNEGSKPWKYVTAPADAEGALSVGSVNLLRERSAFSSIGPAADGRIKPDVMAMGDGVAIFSSSGNISNNGSGTSYASPLMAGFAAGIIQANPTWTREQIINAIRFSGSNWETPDNLIGYGIPNYNYAVVGENAVLSASDILSEKITVYPNPFSNESISINFGGTSIKHTLEISLIDTRGVEIFGNKIAAKDLPGELKIDFSPTEKGIYFLILRSRKFEKKVKLIKI